MHPPARLPVARPIAPRLLAGVAGALATLWTLWACGGGGGERQVTGPPAPPKLVELWLEVDEHTPARTAADSMERGEVRTLHAKGRLSDGRTAGVDSAVWTVGDTAVLKTPTFPRAELLALSSVGEGSTSVAATAGGLRAEVRYTVLRPRVRSVDVVLPNTLYRPPAPDSVVVRSSRQYQALVGSKGGVLTDRPVTWQSADTTVATVSASGAISGRALGTTTVTATVEGVSGSKEIVVRPPLAARLEFTYAPDSLYMRRRDSVRAVFYDSAGARMAVQPNVRVNGAATLLDGGAASTSYVSASYVGATEIVASGDGLTVRRPLRVLTTPQGPPTAYPAAVAVVAGTSVLLAARASDLDGFAFASALAPTYTSADPAVASVTDAGVVTARVPGATTVRVRTGATQADVPVTVVAAGAFGIEVRSATAAALPPALASALTDAARLWERAILGDLPDVRFTLPTAACSLTPPPTDELSIDDVLVFASADSIDGPGGILAQAGPCVYRSDGTAVVGRMQVDSADVALLVARGRLVSVLQHEFGHVLGIGTLWGLPALGYVTRSGFEWRYQGPRGRRVGDWWGRTVTIDAAGGVPLGEAGGPGSGHWSEAAFGNELMTPVIGTGPTPLSLITLEALADLGYQTSPAAAEAYALYAGVPAAGPAASRGVAAGAAPAESAPFERVLTAEWRVVRPGRLVRVPR